MPCMSACSDVLPLNAPTSVNIGYHKFYASRLKMMGALLEEEGGYVRAVQSPALPDDSLMLINSHTT